MNVVVGPAVDDLVSGLETSPTPVVFCGCTCNLVQLQKPLLHAKHSAALM